MSEAGGRPIRGYRPSRYGNPDEEGEAAAIARLANLDVYAKRARAGLPIFEEVEASVVTSIAGKPAVKAG